MTQETQATQEPQEPQGAAPQEDGPAGRLHNAPPQALCASIAGRPEEHAISDRAQSLADDLRGSLEQDLRHASEALEASASRLEKGLERARASGEIADAGAVAVAASVLAGRAEEASSVVRRFIERISVPWSRSHGASKGRIDAAAKEARSILGSLGEQAIERIRKEGLSSEPQPLRIRLSADSLPEGTEALDVRVNVAMRDGFEIEDPSAVPRELCVPDRAAVGKAVKAGRDVPGVRRTQRPSVTVLAPKAKGEDEAGPANGDGES